MANVVYPLARQRLLEWAFGLETPPTGFVGLFVTGVTSAYAYNPAHEHVSSLTGIVAPTTQLGSVTVENGIINADDLRISGMTIGETLDALILSAEWADDDLLIAYMDTPGDASIPQVINSTLGLIAFDPQGLVRI